MNPYDIISPCDTCGTPGDDRPRWRDELRDCPDCGARIK